MQGATAGAAQIEPSTVSLPTAWSQRLAKLSLEPQGHQPPQPGSAAHVGGGSGSIGSLGSWVEEEEEDDWDGFGAELLRSQPRGYIGTADIGAESCAPHSAPLILFRTKHTT